MLISRPAVFAALDPRAIARPAVPAGLLRLTSDALTIVGLVVGLYYLWMLHPGTPFDAHAYYGANLADPYRGSVLNGFDAYLYSPAFAQLLEPFRALPFETFVVGLRLAALLALVWLVGPLTLPILLLGPVASELNAGNINLFLAVVAVAGLRHPGLWAFALLTKVTPAVGLVWFVVRREWRNLGIALGVTGVIALASAVLAPHAWADWLRLLTTEAAAGRTPDWEAVPLPLLVRLMLATLLVAWGARADQRWVVPVAMFLAMPATWWITLSVLVGVVAVLLGIPESGWHRRLGPIVDWRSRAQQPVSTPPMRPIAIVPHPAPHSP